MIKNCVFILLLSIFITFCSDVATHNPAQKKISSVKAKADIETLVQILKAVHPSLYLYQTEKRFNFIKDSIVQSVKEDVTMLELYNKTVFIINEIGCNHTNVELPAYMYDTLQNRAFFFPYPVKFIEDKLLVNVTGYELAAGTEITKINGVAVKKILADIAAYNAVEGLHRKTQQLLAAEDFGMNYFLKYGAQEKFELTVIDTNRKMSSVLEKPVSLSEWNDRNYSYKYYYDRVAVDYDFFIDEKKSYALMRLATFSFDGVEKTEAFENFCYNSFELLAAKRNIKNLIIDVRENTGGDLGNCYLLFSYLTNTSFTEFEKAVSKIKKLPYASYLSDDFSINKEADVNDKLAADFTPQKNKNYYILADSLIDNWSPAVNRFNGNVFVITNSRVASAASYFSLMVKNSGTGKIAGEETSGGTNSGNGFTTLEYVMPNSKIKLLLPYAHIIYSYKDNENKGSGVMPNYYVPDSYLSFKANEDRQVNFIIDTLIKNQ
jgi:C-terminal processing protease CtpA/Prc